MSCILSTNKLQYYDHKEFDRPLEIGKNDENGYYVVNNGFAPILFFLWQLVNSKSF